MLEELADELYNSLIETAKNSLNKTNKKQIEFLLDTTGIIKNLSFELGLLQNHVHQITEGKFSAYKEIKSKEYACLRIAVIGNRLDDFFNEAWHELGITLRSLVVGNYRNISRPLRWILECICMWAHTQLEQPTSKQVYKQFYKMKLNKKDYLYQFNVMRETARTAFQQRILTKEKYDKPTFKEIVNSFAVLHEYQSKEIYSKFEDDFKKLYDETSGLIHISHTSLTELMTGETVYTSGSYYAEHFYHKKLFSYYLDQIWKVIDLVFTLVILVLLKFHEYKTPFEFFKAVMENEYQQFYDVHLLIHNLRKNKKSVMPYFLSLTNNLAIDKNGKVIRTLM